MADSDGSSQSSESHSSSDEELRSTNKSVGGNINLPAILDGKFFEISKEENESKVSAKCKLCPNKTLAARINSTSNLLKHLKVS